MSTSTEKKITLKSSDGETFVVDKEVALMAQTIKHLMDEIDEDLILLPNVTGVILAKVIEYCNKHVKDNETDFSKDLRAWDTKFVEVEQSTLFDLIMAANYLDIKSLLDLTCKTVADMFKGKSTKEIRKTFNIKNDYTPEEEAEIRKELHWAFE